MNCFCDRNYVPVMGVGQWDWGSFAQDIVKAGLQVGTTYAASELGGGGTQTSTGVNPALVNPYQYQQPYAQQPPAAATPAWVWPVVIGGGLLALALVYKMR